MKKTIFLVSAFFLPWIISGQSSFEAILKSRSLSESGEHLKAIEILSSSIYLKEDGRLYAERGNVSILAGDGDKAISDFRRANELAEHSGDYGLARIYGLKGDAKESLRYLEMNLLSRYRKSEKEVLLDPAFTTIEYTPEWRQFWKKEWFTALETGISELEYYIAAGKKREAADKLSELQGMYKGKDEVEYANALVLLSSAKPAEAVRILTGISDSGNEKVLRLLARAQTEALNHAGASATYTKLLEMEIPDAGLILLRADCYRKTGENARSMADVEKYLSLYPGDNSALRLAGKVKSAEGNNLSALEYFNENLKYHPGDPECYIDRANSFMALKSWEPAISDYSMSLDLDPSNPDAWLSKGVAQSNSGKTEDACHDFRYALKLGNKRAADYISKYCIK
jgi:tetratricopeptide (TPR) repeat protein